MKRVKRTIKRSTETETPLLFECFDDFYSEKEARNLSPATLKNYKQSFEKFAEFHQFNEETETNIIKASHIHKFINSMRRDGIKAASINHYLRDVRTFLYWCMDSEREYIDPPFNIELAEAQEESLKLFNADEVERLLEKPGRKATFVEWRTYAIVNWVLATGNRAHTICAIKLTDVDFSNREIHLGLTKQKKVQTLPLSTSLETCLKEYIKKWRKNAPVDGFLFPNVGEEQLTTNALRLSFGRYCNDRGIDKTNIHGLRHTFAKSWIKNKGNVFTLQKLLGHSTLNMTRKYVALFSDDLKENYDNYAPLDNFKKGSSRKQKVTKSE